MRERSDSSLGPWATCPRDYCYFCWYVLTRGLASGVSGGGQIGDWTGTRPNYQGS